MILLTGATGFIGRHLLKGLLKKYGQDDVIVLTSSALPTGKYLLHENYSFDANYLVSSGYGAIDTIVHAGAFTPPNKSEANSLDGASNNILSTRALLSATLPNLKRFIFLSTLDVYGESATIDERSPLEPGSLYAYSKLFCEKMVESWASTSGKICQVLRIGHVYGPGEERYEKIIPSTFKKLIERKDLQIWGSGNERRSFIYVEDVVRAILRSIDLDAYAGVINIVGGGAVTINQLVSLLIRVSGVDAEIHTIPSSAGRDFVFDNSRMKEILVSEEARLEDGLAAEWEYMKQQYR